MRMSGRAGWPTRSCAIFAAARTSGAWRRPARAESNPGRDLPPSSSRSPAGPRSQTHKPDLVDSAKVCFSSNSDLMADIRAGPGCARRRHQIVATEWPVAPSEPWDLHSSHRPNVLFHAKEVFGVVLSLDLAEAWVVWPRRGRHRVARLIIVEVVHVSASSHKGLHRPICLPRPGDAAIGQPRIYPLGEH